MAEDGKGEVVGDEHSVVFGDGQFGTVLIDDGFHDGAQLLVEENLQILHADGREDGTGLFGVVLHPYKHGEQAIGPVLVGGVSDDLVGDLALEDPHGEVADVGEVVVEGLACHAGSARDSGNRHLRQWDGREGVAQGACEPLFRIGVGHQ